MKEYKGIQLTNKKDSTIFSNNTKTLTINLHEKDQFITVILPSGKIVFITEPEKEQREP